MSSKALRQMYKEHHIRIHCGQNDAMPERVSCAECLAKDLERHTQTYESLSGETKAAYLQKCNERQREKRKRLAAKGICTTCLKRPMSKGYRSCIECRTKDAQKRARTSLTLLNFLQVKDTVDYLLDTQCPFLNVFYGSSRLLR